MTEQEIDARCDRIATKLADLTAGCRYLFEVGDLMGDGYATSARTELHPAVLPPLAEVDVQRLEERHLIELPREYRAFLVRVMSGGVGPAYGLLTPDSWTSHLWLDDDVADTALSHPCVLLDDRALASLEQNTVGNDQSDRWLEGLSGFNKKALVAERWSPYFGTACVCYTGCSQFTGLILNGQYSGRIFEMDAEHYPIHMYDGGFIDWYEVWIDGALARKLQR